MAYTISITIGSYSFDDGNLKSLEINDALINDSSISIGNTGASTYTMQLYNINYDGQPNNVSNIVVGESIVINLTNSDTGVTTTIANGSVTELEKDRILTTIKGADAMITVLGNPLELTDTEIESLKQETAFSVSDLQDLIDSKFGVSVVLPSFVTSSDFDMFKFGDFVDMLAHKPTGREIVGMIASLGCANAYINPEGSATTISMTKLPDSYQATYTITPSITYRFSTAMCTSKVNAVNINDVFYSASIPSSGQYNLIVDVDNELLKYLQIPSGETETYNYTKIWEYLNGLNYIGFEATCPGNVSVKPGDCVLIVDQDNNQQQSVVFSITTKYDGAYTRTYSARTAKTSTYEINKPINKTSDGFIAKTILEEGTETNEAIKKVAGGGGGGMPLEGLEMFTELKTWALKYNSSLDRWLFVSGSLPSSMTAVIFTSEGDVITKRRVTFAQPLSDTDQQGNTYYYYTSANTQSVTVNGSPLYFTSSDFEYADTGQQTTEFPVKIPTFDTNYNEMEFEGIFAKEITAVSDMYSSDYATGDVGYILEAVT